MVVWAGVGGAELGRVGLIMVKTGRSRGAGREERADGDGMRFKTR